MASLGSFEAALRERDPASSDPVTFEFCGKTFTVTGEIPAILELTLIGGMAGKASVYDTQVALYDALRHALTIPGAEPDLSQWDEFSRLAADNGVQRGVLSEIAFRIMGYLVARPTEQQSDSSPGLLPTGTNSNSSASDIPASQD